MSEKLKRPRGRPVKNEMPEPIPDTPENIMRAFLKTPPRKNAEWKFMRDRQERSN